MSKAKDKKCLHTDCMRTADKKCKGYCSKCYQIPDKVCNRCEVNAPHTTNWKTIIANILMFACAGMIIGSIIMAVRAENVMGVAGWTSAFVWFIGYLFQQRLSKHSLEIALLSIKAAQDILEEIELTPEQLEKLKNKVKK